MSPFSSFNHAVLFIVSAYLIPNSLLASELKPHTNNPSNKVFNELNDDSTKSENLLDYYWSSIENPEKYLFKFTTTSDNGTTNIQYWKIENIAKDRIKYISYVSELDSLIQVAECEEIITENGVYWNYMKFKISDKWVYCFFKFNEAFKGSEKCNVISEVEYHWEDKDVNYMNAYREESQLFLSEILIDDNYIDCVKMKGIIDYDFFQNYSLKGTEHCEFTYYWAKGKGSVRREKKYPNNPSKNSVTIVEMLPDPSFYKNKSISVEPKYTYLNNEGYKFAYVDQDKAMEIFQNTANVVGGSVSSESRISWWQGGEGEELYENYYSAIELEGVHCMYEIPWAVLYTDYNSTQAYETGDCSGNLNELLGMYPETKGQFSEGLETGLWIMYWQNGNIRMKTNYLNGKKNGPSEAFFETGELEAKAVYTNDQIDGESTFYYKNGMIQAKRFWVLGEKTGDWIDFDETGNELRKRKFENGKLISCEGLCD